jgi:branched-chain amino acid transport system ATP-binding protein
MPEAAMLRIQSLTVAYGGIQAVRGIDLEVRAGELVALIGANGAGKTTTLKALAGLLPASAGDVQFLGRSIHKASAHDRVAMGIALVPEGRGIFTRMTTLENLRMGAHLRRDPDGIQSDIERMFERFPRLKERSGQLAGTLSGGEQQMLALARALMSRPTMLLLDEPSMGLAPIMVARIFEVVRELAAQGATILLVEQNARLALQAAHRAYVMETGTITVSGPAKPLLDDPRIRQAYLGE